MRLFVRVAVALFLLMGSAAPVWAQSAQTGPNPPNIEGVWALKLVTVAESKAPLIGDVTSETTSYERVTIEQSGTDLELTEQVCDVRVRSSQDAVQTIIPDRFVEHLRTVERPGTLEREDGRWRINVPKHLKFFGVKPSVGTAKLPEQPDSKYVFDQDKDGHPGMTIELEGLLSGSLYVIQRSWDVLAGKRYKGGQFAGQLDWKTDQIVLEKTGRVFGEMAPSKPVLEKSYFRLVPVEGKPSCQEIVSKKDKIF